MTAGKVLLVIDVQDSFYKMPYWTDEGFEEYKQRQNGIIRYARSEDMPVIHVIHNESAGPFAKGSGLDKSMDWVDRRPEDPEFRKTVHNALTESGLSEWLGNNRISEIMVSGLRTEQCCETTARVASDLGFDVEYVVDATHTFPMVHPENGKIFTQGEVREKTVLVLAKRFAKVTYVKDYAAMAD